MLLNKLLPGTVLRTDGYPLYPAVANILSLRLEILYHSEGFFNNLGQTTNHIENFWMPLKTEIKSRCGIIYSRILSFI
jgi:hypothetical protein